MGRDLIQDGKAYVDDLSADEIREYRGTLTEPGTDSPWRDRSVDESLDLFARMRAGEFPDGARCSAARSTWPRRTSICATRCSIASARGPSAHGRHVVHLPALRLRPRPSDAIEGITHSLCTLEFEDHRPLYDWLSRTCRCRRAAPVRIRSAEPDLHRDEQAQAAASS